MLTPNNSEHTYLTEKPEAGAEIPSNGGPSLFGVLRQKDPPEPPLLSAPPIDNPHEKKKFTFTQTNYELYTSSQTKTKLKHIAHKL